MNAYRLKYMIGHSHSYWRVMKGNKVLAAFIDKGEAMNYVQACIEDDNWHAMNRD